ncbi:hypothetical protein KIN20_030847 [Parelaphostrongylus tenuis]|uniref:26S proteasome non-ATPase regulatory subunit 1/RPN2 N-terminal domain-containing protein n=1 Tax=Parelaphostrongylus tenuis TaxID=148309 RepID=A0AAD5R4L4_PARTN|nr:hypothetical protein KIN20_030847 [Parelaphostrongylus tenuis]
MMLKISIENAFIGMNINANDENGDLIAYQIAFDLYENASQQFNTQVLDTYASLHQPSPRSKCAATILLCILTNLCPT